MDKMNAGARRVVVILGASGKPGRHSGQLFRRLAAHPEFEVIPVHPTQGMLDGQPVVSSLVQVKRAPDILTVYVNSGISQALAEEMVKLGPKRVIFNPGAENPTLQKTLQRNGIATEEACSLVLLSQNAF